MTAVLHTAIALLALHGVLCLALAAVDWLADRGLLDDAPLPWEGE